MKIKENTILININSLNSLDNNSYIKKNNADKKEIK